MVESDELILALAEWLARIEASLGLRPGAAKELARERYTRTREERPSVPRILFARRIGREAGGLVFPSLQLAPAPDRRSA
jgi:hypothetical protein